MDRTASTRTGIRVDDIDAEGVTCDAEKLRAHSVFWAAGVQAARLAVIPPVESDRSGRLKVGRDCSIPGHPNVFVVG